MARNDKQSTEEVNVQMRRSFSWDRAFLTNDGFLDADELSSMIEGDGNDVKQQLQKIEEIESMEAKLFQEIEASTQKNTETSNTSSSSNNLSSGKKDSKPKKARSAPNASPASSEPIKTVKPTRSSGSSQGNKAKSPARRSTASKTGKGTPASPSKTSAGITKKDKVAPVNTNTSVSRTPRTAPASPVSSGPSSSKFSVNQQSKRGSSVPRRSSVNSEKPSEINARKKDEWTASKPAVTLIPKTQSNIGMKSKPPPVISHPSPGLINASSSSTDQRAKPMSNKGSTVHHRSKSTLKKRPETRSPKVASRPETRSPKAAQTRKLSAPKTVAAVDRGLKPTSQKTTTPKASKKQSKAKAKSPSGNSRVAENIVLASPEVMDIKGKLNALKMEVSTQKKDRCKGTKMSHGQSGKGESSSINQKKIQTKPI